MKKLNTLSESSFLKLFFAFISFAFLLVSFFLPGDLISGFGKILTSTCKVTTNYFASGRKHKAVQIKPTRPIFRKVAL